MPSVLVTLLDVHRRENYVSVRMPTCRGTVVETQAAIAAYLRADLEEHDDQLHVAPADATN